MKNNFNNLNENETKFLRALLEDGSKTDALISKEIGLSKSTVHRIRKGLQEKKIITDYIPIIDLESMGLSTYVVLMFHWAEFKNKVLTKKMLGELESDYHVIFLGNGEGSEGLTTCVFFGFESLEEYNRYLKKFREKYEDYIRNLVSLLIPNSEILKHDFTDFVKNMINRRGGSYEK